MNRAHRKYFRVSDDELKLLDELAGNMRTSTYVRQCALGRPPLRVPEVNREVYVELQRIGINLNQISKHLNTAPSTRALIEQAEASVTSLRNALTSMHLKGQS